MPTRQVCVGSIGGCKEGMEDTDGVSGVGDC